MRAVIDTNVSVSAAISPSGPPAEIVRAWRQNAFIWVISRPLFDELQHTFSRSRVSRYFVWGTAEIADFLARLNLVTFALALSPPLNVVRDATDNRVLEAAIAGEADYIVSGDDDLLSLGSYEGIAIVWPARFLAILSTTQS